MVNNIVNICYQLGTFNYEQHTHENNHNINIACRLCNQVLSNFQAFKTHIESHFAHENHTKRGIYSPHPVNSQREMIPSLLQPNITRSMMMQENGNFVNNGVSPLAPPQPMGISQPRTNSFPCASQQAIATSQQFQLLQRATPNMSSFWSNPDTLFPTPPIYQREMEVSPIDGTRPFINLLEKPINDNKFVNWANLNGDILDLVLRL